MQSLEETKSTITGGKKNIFTFGTVPNLSAFDAFQPKLLSSSLELYQIWKPQNASKIKVLELKVLAFQNMLIHKKNVAKIPIHLWFNFN